MNLYEQNLSESVRAEPTYGIPTFLASVKCRIATLEKAYFLVYIVSVTLKMNGVHLSTQGEIKIPYHIQEYQL